MKFVFLSYTYAAGFSTAESWLQRIEMYAGVYEWLAKTNTVEAIHQIDYTGEHVDKGVRYHFVDFRAENRYFPGKLHRFVQNLNPDVVVVHGLHQPLQLIQLRLVLPGRVRVMVQHHAEKPFRGFKKYLQRIAGYCADAFLFTSTALGQDWIAEGNLPKGTKIYEVMEISSVFYPVEKHIARAKTGAQGDLVFLWVGRLNENKDPLNVVSAFLKFVTFQPSARLYMIYHTEELLSAVTALLRGHEHTVTLIGRLSHGDLLYWFNSADFLLSGSFYEGGGTAVCEAMSCGCVPVVTDIPTFRMVTDQGKCGILYEAGNESALLEALMQAVRIDPEEKKRLCLEYYRAELSFEAIAAKFDQIAASL